MSSFYDDASLVMIPSCYKVGTVLCEKPTDGSGDLTFTRTGDTATRVGPDGLIQEVRTNLFVRSETFTSASWLSGGGGASVFTDNFATAPNGTLTAAKWTAANTNSQVRQNVATINTTATISVYLRTNSGTKSVTLFVNDYVATSVVTVTTSWQRFTLTGVVGATLIGSGRCGFSNVTVLTAGDYVEVWGAQYEISDFGATTYIPTTTAAVSVGPVANVPRLDYLGSSCGKLLLEPQRTNLYNYSEQLNQWTASSATVTANYAVSPDGYTNADRVQFSAGGLLYIGGTGSAGENTLSVYAKATNGTSAKFRFFGNGNTTFSSDQTATGQWQRFTFTYTFSASTAGLKVATTGADDVIFYGFQHEIGAYATSYIPTLAAAATRSVDDATKTGITSLIGQTEGTLFLDFEGGANDSANHFLGLSDGTSSNRIVIVRSSTNTLYTLIRVAGVDQALIQTATLTANTRYKCAVAYKLNDIVFYVNGVQVGTDTAATIPATSVFATNTGVSSSYFERAINQTLIFKTRLTNAELAELTTL